MSDDKSERAKEDQKCGIVMPIGSIGSDYSSDHWGKVLEILKKSITRAGMTPIPVWENYEIDVIQETILKNLYESDVVICDVSGLNPNVMLETGLRLSTKRPTIIIHDRENKVPFDIQSINQIFYKKTLEYNSIDKFIEELSEKIVSINKSFESGNYVPFAEKFKFETATPKEITITSEQYIISLLQDMQKKMYNLENVINARECDEKNKLKSHFKSALNDWQFSIIDKYDKSNFTLEVDTELSYDEILRNIPKELIKDIYGYERDGEAVIFKNCFKFHINGSRAKWKTIISKLSGQLDNALFSIT